MLRIYLFSFLLHFTHSTVNKHLKISCGLEEISRDSVAMRFYVQLDNKGKDCKVECTPDRCCLDQGDEENCDVLQMFGGCLETVPAGESKTVRLVAPLLDPFDRRGYCVVHLYSKLKGHPIYRDTVTIPFDTGNPSHVKPCPGIDQDPQNDCQPVNCDTYYNGNKPHFSKRLERCIETPPCSDDEVYEENLNKCVRIVTEEDIEAIKSLSNRKMRSSAIKNITSRTAGDDVDQELDIPQSVLDNYKAGQWPLRYLDYLRSPKVLFCVICAQCALVLALIYYIRNRCKCISNKKKEVLNRFFNSRQDNSITTPLLSGSHQTATTCEFQSDSSFNIERKIQFYKACRKDKQPKASMSDDILSRCLKRRDWIAKQKTSEVIPESKYKEEPIQTLSLTDNCAQACFSKDSIDDFLSERGLLSISGSRKISKDNVVLSLMSHKLGPASDPGGRSENLELLHMSRLSFSSSDYELRRTVESRSSL